MEVIFMKAQYILKKFAVFLIAGTLVCGTTVAHASTEARAQVDTSKHTVTEAEYQSLSLGTAPEGYKWVVVGPTAEVDASSCTHAHDEDCGADELLEHWFLQCIDFDKLDPAVSAIGTRGTAAECEAYMNANPAPEGYEWVSGSRIHVIDPNKCTHFHDSDCGALTNMYTYWLEQVETPAPDTDTGNDQIGGDENNGGDDQDSGDENNGGDDQNSGDENNGGDDQNSGDENNGGDDQNSGNENNGGDDQNNGDQNNGSGDDQTTGDNHPNGDQNSGNGNGQTGGDQSNNSGNSQTGDDQSNGNGNSQTGDDQNNDNGNDTITDNNGGSGNDTDDNTGNSDSAITTPDNGSDNGDSGNGGNGGSTPSDSNSNTAGNQIATGSTSTSATRTSFSRAIFAASTNGLVADNAVPTAAGTDFAAIADDILDVAENAEIEDNETPLASNSMDEQAVIEDAEVPLAAAEDTCIIHWIILLLTLLAGGYNLVRAFLRIRRNSEDSENEGNQQIA
jgi:hypothetical protein